MGEVEGLEECRDLPIEGAAQVRESEAGGLLVCYLSFLILLHVTCTSLCFYPPKLLGPKETPPVVL